MKDIEKLKTETMEIVKDVLRHCDKEETILNVIDWAIKEIADQCVKNVLEVYTPKK